MKYTEEEVSNAIKIIESCKDTGFLKARIEAYNPYKAKGRRGNEWEFQKYAISKIPLICEELDWSCPIKIMEQFELWFVRFDILTIHDNGIHTVWEVKIDNGSDQNSETIISYAVGQLLTYKTVLNLWGNVPEEKINLVLLTNFDSELVHCTVLLNRLPIIISEIGEQNINIVYENGKSRKTIKI